MSSSRLQSTITFLPNTVFSG